ncbi:MAG TPA: response regulator transcription factor [Opitutaceae bacterium]|jgi:two-component system response regulator NreC
MSADSSIERGTVLHVDAEAASAVSVFRHAIEITSLRHLGVATTAAAGIEAARRLQPTMVILDLFLPDMDGHTLIAALLALAPKPLLLVLTTRADDATLFRLGKLPVNGIIWKTLEAVRELPVAIQEISRGRGYFPRSVQQAMQRLRTSPNCFFKILSDQELELLPLLGAGQSDAEIAKLLSLSASTIHSHRQRIMSKLGLHTSVDLMRWAMAKGFVHIARSGPPCVSTSWISNSP